jgi:hypothetical protein
MSLSDVVRAVRGACQCRSRSQGTPSAAPSTEQPVINPGVEAETVISPLPNGVSRAIDVSQLPPPLPMVRILETLRELGPSETLLVHHTRRPIHLYPKLEALGCRHETIEPVPGKIEVRITNPPARPL